MERDIYYSSIDSLSKLIQQQQLSPVEIVEQCLKRIQKHNPEINAFITVIADQAREQARVAETEISAGKWRGPLHGIPVGVKDFYDTAGIKTTAAFEHFTDRAPGKDAVPVAKLKEAGAIIVGKMNMHRLGMGTTGLDSYFGLVQNPWNAQYIPGGSSSGSAAAIASGLCCATLDTDAIGSCRLPAACCGVVGFKGTFGLISTSGILEGEEPPDDFIKWMNHPGITARSVKDVAAMLEVLAEQNEDNKSGDFVRALNHNGNIRLGIADNFIADADVSEAFERTVKIIRGFHHSIRTAAIPFGNSNGDISNIESDRSAIAGQAFKDIDVLLLPTMPTMVPTVDEVASKPQGLSAEHTAFANYYGLPAISVPCGFDKNGLPLGLQIVGKPWDDATVVRIANEFEAATEFGRRHPIV